VTFAAPVSQQRTCKRAGQTDAVQVTWLGNNARACTPAMTCAVLPLDSFTVTGGEDSKMRRGVTGAVSLGMAGTGARCPGVRHASGCPPDNGSCACNVQGASNFPGSGYACI